MAKTYFEDVTGSGSGIPYLSSYFRFTESTPEQIVNYGLDAPLVTLSTTMGADALLNCGPMYTNSPGGSIRFDNRYSRGLTTSTASADLLGLESYFLVNNFVNPLNITGIDFILRVDNADLIGKEQLIAMVIPDNGSPITELGFALTVTPVVAVNDTYGVTLSNTLKFKFYHGSTSYGLSINQPSGSIVPGRTYFISIYRSITSSSITLTLDINSVRTTATTSLSRYTYNTTSYSYPLYIGGLPSSLASTFPNITNLCGSLCEIAFRSGSMLSSTSTLNNIRYHGEGRYDGSSTTYQSPVFYRYTDYPLNHVNYNPKSDVGLFSINRASVSGSQSRVIKWLVPPVQSTSSIKVNSQTTDASVYSGTRVPALYFSNGAVGKIDNSSNHLNIIRTSYTTFPGYIEGTSAGYNQGVFGCIAVAPTSPSQNDQVILNIKSEYPWKLVFTGDNNTTYGPRKFIIYPNGVAPATSPSISNSPSLSYGKSYVVYMSRPYGTAYAIPPAVEGPYTGGIMLAVNGSYKYNIPWTIGAQATPGTSYIGADDSMGSYAFTGLITSFYIEHSIRSIEDSSYAKSLFLSTPYPYLAFNIDSAGSGITGDPIDLKLPDAYPLQDSSLKITYSNNTTAQKPCSVRLSTIGSYGSQATYTNYPSGTAYPMTVQRNGYEALVFKNNPLAYWKLDELTGNFAGSGTSPATLTRVGSIAVQNSGAERTLPIRSGARGSTYFGYYTETGLSDNYALSTATNYLVVSSTTSWALECVFLLSSYYGYRSSVSFNAAYTCLIHKGSTSTATYSIHLVPPGGPTLYNNETLYNDPATEKRSRIRICFDYSVTASGGSGFFLTDPLVELNKVYHIVLNRTPTEVAIYLNGEKVWFLEVLPTQVLPSGITPTSRLSIGGFSSTLSSGSINSIFGYISDVAVYPAALSEEDIIAKQPYVYECYLERENQDRVFDTAHVFHPIAAPERTYSSNTKFTKLKNTGPYGDIKSFYRDENSKVVIPRHISYKPNDDNLCVLMTQASSTGASLTSYGVPGYYCNSGLYTLESGVAKTIEFIIHTRFVSSEDNTIIHQAKINVPQYTLYISGDNSRHGSRKLILEGLDHRWLGYPRQVSLPKLEDDKTYVITLTKSSSSGDIKIYLNGSLYNIYTGWDYRTNTTDGTYLSGENRLYIDKLTLGFAIQYYSYLASGYNYAYYNYYPTYIKQFGGWLVSTLTAPTELSSQDISTRYNTIMANCTSVPAVIQGTEGTVELSLTAESFGSLFLANPASLTFSISLWTYVRSETTTERIIEEQLPAPVKVNASINSNLYPMTPNFVYLMQVKSMYEDLKKAKEGKKFIPLQFGGIDGQRIISDEALVLNISDFDFN